MATLAVWIIGCGYTGRRVAQRLLDTGMPVVATTRNPDSLRDLAAQGVEVLRWDASDPDGFEILKAAITPGAGVLLSVPTLRGPHGPDDPTPRIVQALGDAPSRVVYLSTTGVYGDAREADENTPAAPVTERQRLRVEAEQAVMKGPWPSLVLRPAAIYGPGRGVHVALREGSFQLANDGSNFVSRIHVDDLATHAGHSLLSDLTGAYPVADEEPCSSREMAEFCANLLGLPLPESVGKEKLSETRRSDRRVNGSAIRRLLGIELRYSSYRQGIPAALKEEGTTNPVSEPPA